MNRTVFTLLQNNHLIAICLHIMLLFLLKLLKYPRINKPIILPVKTNPFIIYFLFIRECHNWKLSFWHIGKAKKKKYKHKNKKALVLWWCDNKSDLIWFWFIYLFILNTGQLCIIIIITRMYISRRKCEMVLAVAKLGAGQILVTSMFAIIFLAWLASCYHVASMISMLLACCWHD